MITSLESSESIGLEIQIWALCCIAISVCKNMWWKQVSWIFWTSNFEEGNPGSKPAVTTNKT